VAASFVAEIDAPGGRIRVRTCQLEQRPPVVVFPSAGEYPIYDDFARGQMAEDEIRMARFTAAVRRYSPGRTVLDIGTGQDALWAVEAARAGARHVWAVEVIPRSAQLAREAAGRAGVADRITVLEGLSTGVTLPEPVDVCVAEIIGTLGGSEGAGAVLRDARQRLLRPGGVVVPHRSATTAVAVELAEPPALVSLALPYVRQIFTAVGRPFDVRMCLAGLQDDPELRERTYLSNVADVEVLEFNGGLRPEGADRATLTVTRPGRLTGLALGVRLEVADGDAPIDSLTQPSNWLPVYAPLSDVGVAVNRGDRIEFTFTTRLSDDRIHPDYALEGELHRDGAPPARLRWRSAHHDEGFRASPFYRTLFPPP
jgi:type I protein arginine methyltransferase